MSADNGLILWKDVDDYVLSEYSASSEGRERERLPRRAQDRNLGRVLLRTQEIMRAEVVEYGLSLDLPESTVQDFLEVVDPPQDIAAPGARTRTSELAEQ